MRFYLTLHIDGPDVVWDLRSGEPDGFSVRLAEGRAFTWAAAFYQAGSFLMKHTRREP